MTIVKRLISSAAAIGFMCGVTTAAMAETGNIRYQQDAAFYPPQQAAVAGGRQINHPAWSFACAERDVSERIIPCDQPIWVYGSPCEVGTGVQGQTAPCGGWRR
jgi:hypothetical protein